MSSNDLISNYDYHNNTISQVESSIDEEFAVHHNKVPDYDHDQSHQDDGEHEDDIVRDVIMWRRSKISGVLILVATLLWVLLQVYGFHFIPLASWTLMAFATLLFFYGAFFRLLTKKAPKVVSWEVTEQRAKEIGESAKRVIEKGITLMFNVSCEREWYIFLGVIFSLFLLAYVGCYFDLITLLYTGTMVGMTVPVIYVKKEDAIKGYGRKLGEKSKRIYHNIHEKVYSKSNLQEKAKKEE